MRHLAGTHFLITVGRKHLRSTTLPLNETMTSAVKQHQQLWFVGGDVRAMVLEPWAINTRALYFVPEQQSADR